MGGVGRREGREREVFCIWKRFFGSSFTCSFIPPTVLLFFFAECLIILTIQKVISQNSFHHSFSSIISSVKTFL